jgi:DNA-binding FadR family transcriptional regulator
MLRPVEKTSFPDHVFGQLMAEIVSGRLPPGNPIGSERALGDFFGVNRHVIREALKRLEQIGLVQITQGGATRVLDFRRTAGLDLLALMAEHAEAMDGLVPLIRAALEMRSGIGVDVARLCAERASPDVRHALADTAEMLAEVGRGRRLLALDERFWQHVVDGAENIAYQLAFNSLIRGVNAAPDLSVGWLEHELRRGDYRRPIANAIAAGDPDEAAEAARVALAPPAELLAWLAPRQPKRKAAE